LSRPAINEFGFPADGNEHTIERLCISRRVPSLERDGEAALGFRNARDFRLEQNRLGRGLHPFRDNRREITIGAGQQTVRHFDHTHFGSERGVHGSELEPDIPSADDEQAPRYVRHIERRRRVEHVGAVDGNAGHSSGRDPVAMMM
jgi:hypothetical protein